MSGAATHSRVSDDVSTDRVNRVNRPLGSVSIDADDRASTGPNGDLVWRNVAALKVLLGRAERELTREPGDYVAVAVVAADKHEKQVGRWNWSGSADSGVRVADLGRRLAAGARGLRVRVHHDGGGLVGSVLLRRARRHAALAPKVVVVADAGAARTLEALEAKLAAALARIEQQDTEIVAMREDLSRVEHVPAAMVNMHHRLHAVEAICERVEEAEGSFAGGAPDDDEESELYDGAVAFEEVDDEES